MERKSKSQPARKTAAKTAAKRKAAPAKVGKAKAGAKKAATGKSAARKAAATRTGKSGAAPIPGKPKNIFAKNKKKTKSANSRAKTAPAAVEPDPLSIAHSTPLIEALDLAFSGTPPEPGRRKDAPSGERRGNGAFDPSANDQGRPPARRQSSGETGSEPADAPARANKLVPTNAVHTTKRRMKRNTWQSPVVGLGLVAAVLGILVLGNKNEPPDVSPLERRVEARPGAASQQTVEAPRAQDPQQAAPDRGPQIPSRPVQSIVPPARGDLAAPGEPGEQAPPRGLRVLELVEMERMLARLDMDPSQPDGIVDRQTESAIRMYQQIAGLPVDGEPSPELLDDMREVVKMMDGTE